MKRGLRKHQTQALGIESSHACQTFRSNGTTYHCVLIFQDHHTHPFCLEKCLMRITPVHTCFARNYLDTNKHLVLTASPYWLHHGPKNPIAHSYNREHLNHV
jgi:hypothetical protein